MEILITDYTIDKLEMIKEKIRGKFAINFIVREHGGYYCPRWIADDAELSCKVCQELFPKIKSAKQGSYQYGWKCPYFSYSADFIIKRFSFVLNTVKSQVKTQRKILEI